LLSHLSLPFLFIRQLHQAPTMFGILRDFPILRVDSQKAVQPQTNVVATVAIARYLAYFWRQRQCGRWRPSFLLLSSHHPSLPLGSSASAKRLSHCNSANAPIVAKRYCWLVALLTSQSRRLPFMPNCLCNHPSRC